MQEQAVNILYYDIGARKIFSRGINKNLFKIIKYL